MHLRLFVASLTLTAFIVVVLLLLLQVVDVVLLAQHALVKALLLLENSFKREAGTQVVRSVELLRSPDLRQLLMHKLDELDVLEFL